MNNPFKPLTKRDWILWIGSVGIVFISNFATAEFDILTLVAALIGLTISGVLVTGVFYCILDRLHTPNIIFSTISIITSFLATALTMLRSSYYAVGYAANDIVLIVLWVLASIENPAYIPVVVNFAIFFLNDMYGFISWKKRELSQGHSDAIRRVEGVKDGKQYGWGRTSKETFVETDIQGCNR